MKLDVFLPFRVFTSQAEVLRIVAETREGSFGLLPHRLDCVATLVPGILTYATASGGEAFLAVDAGVLVKAGPDVRVSVRRAVGGTDLARLRDAVEAQFRAQDDQQRAVQTVMAKLESGFLRRFAEFAHV